jgi:hypothetical protein
MRDKTKRTYQKPELTQVKLVPEEAVLATCKFNSSSGTSQTDCGADPVCIFTATS